MSASKLYRSKRGDEVRAWAERCDREGEGKKRDAPPRAPRMRPISARTALGGREVGCMLSGSEKRRQDGRRGEGQLGPDRIFCQWSITLLPLLFS
jgi:hypothetical protein